MKNIVQTLDISNYIYSTVHYLCGYNGKNLPKDRVGDYLSRESEKENYLAALDQTIKNQLPNIKGTKEMIVAFDSTKKKSYRYDVYDEYKSSRKAKKKAFCTKSLKECVNRYKEYLQDMGVIVIEKERLEADDIISIASTVLPEKGYSLLILSADKDLAQLVRNNGDTGVYFYDLGKSQLITDKGFKQAEPTDNFEFAGMFSDSDEFQPDPIFDKRIEINPLEVVWTKVISGDKSDSIPASIDYVKGQSIMGVSDKRMGRVFEGIEAPQDISWETLVNELEGKINDEVKTKKTPQTIKLSEAHRKRFERNVSLIRLDQSVIPEWVTTEIEETINNLDLESRLFAKFLKTPIIDQNTKDFDELY